MAELIEDDPGYQRASDDDAWGGLVRRCCWRPGGGEEAGKPG